MDNNNNRYPYPPSDALQAPGMNRNNYPHNLHPSRPPHISANVANTSIPGGPHAFPWNTSQMTFPPAAPPPRPENFQGQPGPPPHQFNQHEPPPPIPGFPPPPPGSVNQPTGFPPPPTGFHPPPGSGLTPPAQHPPPTGFHQIPGSGLAQPTALPPRLHQPGPGPPPLPRPSPPPAFRPPPGSGLPQPPRLPPPSGVYPQPGPVLTPPAGFLPPPAGLRPPPLPGLGPAPPPHHPPPTGTRPPGFLQPPCPPTGDHPPSGFHPSQSFPPPSGSGLPQPPHHHPPPPAGLHSSPGPPPIPSPGPHPFSSHGPGSGVQHPAQKQGYPEVSGRASGFFQERERFAEPVKPPAPEDETTIQRRSDDKWVKQFLESKGKVHEEKPEPQPNEICIRTMKNQLYSTAQLVFQLSTLCENMKLNIDNPAEWSDSYREALAMKQDIQAQLQMLSDRQRLRKMITKLSNIGKKRARKRRAKERLRMEEEDREVERVEKEVEIDRWRMKKMQAEEEKKKEQELKVAADAVLCDVRKKLTDVKRTQNILKSLEKLRKLRKEAASRKGIHTEPESDESFSRLLAELREVAKKWSAVYGAEERVLMVMLEGEQEEERRRDLERRRQRERDKQLRRRRNVQAMLFGDDSPADPLMQPFRQYYTQAEHSLPALVQIRREWDVFLVPVDHPEGSSVPQAWVLPEAPSDQAWASALQSSEDA